MRELAKAHAEQLARAEESIADLVRQLKALPPDDARKEQLAAQLRQQQQALREMRDKFRDQLLCVLTHDAANNGTLADDKVRRVRPISAWRSGRSTGPTLKRLSCCNALERFHRLQESTLLKPKSTRLQNGDRVKLTAGLSRQIQRAFAPAQLNYGACVRRIVVYLVPHYAATDVLEN
ncbi:hypothetical protein HPB52_009461 [Rhipicephalus sanguineus]|uniref:Uncharacterized protein n=1 Tax=Rhipicephalus sanguineus TaxID=34632 RepID=A0A9D4PZ00_RHISA|nr:hypothetical protein HPB52_009461 [Rhipicephalus sanguineus]